MHHYNADGWDFLWMIPMMLLWLALLGGVIYAAVRFAVHHQSKEPLR